MLLKSEFALDQSWLLRISSIWSEIFQREDIEHLISNYKNGASQKFFEHVQSWLYRGLDTWKEISYTCKEIWWIIKELYELFEKQMKISSQNLSWKDKIMCILWKNLQQEKMKIECRKDILEYLKKLEEHFIGFWEKKITFHELKLIDFQSSEDFNDLVDYLQSPKWEVRKRIENVIFVKF